MAPNTAKGKGKAPAPTVALSINTRRTTYEQEQPMTPYSRNDGGSVGPGRNYDSDESPEQYEMSDSGDARPPDTPARVLSHSLQSHDGRQSPEVLTAETSQNNLIRELQQQLAKQGELINKLLQSRIDKSPITSPPLQQPQMMPIRPSQDELAERESERIRKLAKERLSRTCKTMHRVYLLWFLLLMC
jgi:hypothetical protein